MSGSDEAPAPGEVPSEQLVGLEVGSSEQGTAKPRIRNAILVPILAIAVATLASIILLGGAIVVVAGGEVEREEVPQYLETLFAAPWALPLLLIPGQFIFGVAAFGAALCSDLPWRVRLDLKRGRMPRWTWLVMGLASPAAAFPMVLVLHFVEVEPSEQLQLLAEMMMDQTGSMLVVSGFMVSVLPAVVEESLFRGYLQSRLLRRLSAFWAIGISAFIFAIAHLDPMHAMGVFPLGVWLGVIAWRAGTIYPAIIGHFANNLFGFISSQFAEDSESTELVASDVAFFAVLLGLMVASVLLMVRYGSSDEESDD